MAKNGHELGLQIGQKNPNSIQGSDRCRTNCVNKGKCIGCCSSSFLPVFLRYAKCTAAEAEVGKMAMQSKSSTTKYLLIFKTHDLGQMCSYTNAIGLPISLQYVGSARARAAQSFAQLGEKHNGHGSRTYSSYLLCIVG